MPPEPPRLKIAPCDIGAVLALERELGVSHPTAQVLVRRGLADPGAARAWLAAAERHDPSEFAGIDAVCTRVLDHVRAGRRITIHGDYDVDGVCSTAILVRVLRALGADVDWFLPSRAEDGYGLSTATVQRLAVRGTKLLITVDCAITAVDEVAAARAAGMDVVVTDHHSPRADGVLPDAPIVRPAVCGYPCLDLCAAGVAYRLAAALLSAAARIRARRRRPRPRRAGDDRRLRAAARREPPPRARRTAVDRGDEAPGPARAHARRARRPGAYRRDRGRLSPRSADQRRAGRLERADAGLELMLTPDEIRAAQIADELDRLNSERRMTRRGSSSRPRRC